LNNQNTDFPPKQLEFDRHLNVELGIREWERHLTEQGMPLDLVSQMVGLARDEENEYHLKMLSWWPKA
jgi:hypothetical protein